MQVRVPATVICVIKELIKQFLFKSKVFYVTFFKIANQTAIYMYIANFSLLPCIFTTGDVVMGIKWKVFRYKIVQIQVPVCPEILKQHYKGDFFPRYRLST